MTSKRPKLLFFDFVTHYGGAQRSTVHLLDRLNQAFEVCVLDPYGVCPDYAEALERAGVPVEVILDQARSCYIGGTNHTQRVLSVAKQVPDWMALCTGVRRAVEAASPDVVLTNSYKAMALLWMSGVVKTHPIAYYARGWYQREQIPWLGRWLIKKAQRILAVSNPTAEALKRWPMHQDRIRVCHTVIDFESVLTEGQCICQTLPNSPKTAFKILLPAQLLPAKGQRIAVDAAEVMKRQGLDFVMWMAGDVKMGVQSQWHDDLQDIIDRQGLGSHVFLLGHRSDVRALMTRADVVILPSQTEGFPRTIWEAMTLKRPVIATPVGGIVDLIIDEKTGLLVPLDDAAALAEAIVRLATEPDLTLRLAQAGLDHVTGTYSEEVTLTRISETLMDMCER